MIKDKTNKKQEKNEIYGRKEKEKNEIEKQKKKKFMRHRCCSNFAQQAPAARIVKFQWCRRKR